jgi:hypothetical protein
MRRDFSSEKHHQILSWTGGRGRNPCLLSVRRAYVPPPYLATSCSLKSGGLCYLCTFAFDI